MQCEFWSINLLTAWIWKNKVWNSDIWPWSCCWWCIHVITHRISVTSYEDLYLARSTNSTLVAVFSRHRGCVPSYFKEISSWISCISFSLLLQNSNRLSCKGRFAFFSKLLIDFHTCMSLSTTFFFFFCSCYSRSGY